MIAIGAARLTLPPGSFLQATAAGEEALAARVTAHCQRAGHVADLFCGDDRSRAARREGAGFGVRQRRRRGGGVAEGGIGDSD